VAYGAVADYQARMPPATPPLLPTRPLSHADLRTVVRLAPLVSIDLVIRNAQNQVLLGLRENEPAKGFYFVPGGMIRKGEHLREAFARILHDETNCAAQFEDAAFLGVYEHFYDANRFGEAGYGTHYVALGYALTLADTIHIRADSQHSALEWWDEAALLAAATVHHNTKAYFR
jgi:GDP-mannose mannosyl hydrolase